MKIQTRIILSILAVTAFGFINFTQWIVNDLGPQYRKVTEEPLVDLARVLAGIAGASARDDRLDRELFRQSFAHIKNLPFSARIYDYDKTGVDLEVYLTDATGLVVFDSLGESEGLDFSRKNDVFLTLKGLYGARTSHRQHNGVDYSVMYVAAPVLGRGGTIGVLSVGKPTRTSNLFVARSKRKIMLAGVMIFGAVILLGALVSLMITGPIKRLTAYAQAVRDGLRPPLPKFGKNETGQLAEAFEQMRNALEDRQYVENYVSTLTHEIKSPLAAISGAAELLTEDMEPDQRRRFMANIRTEAQRIESVIQKLLVLSRLESGRIPEKPVTIALGGLVGEILEALCVAVKEKGLEIETTGDLDATIIADRFLIHHAVINLVQNAVDFSPEKGKIAINVSAEGGAVSLSVRDAGPGIAEYALPRVFERFYSLPRPDTSRKGTGLGLCLAREAALLHGGDVTIKNAPERGVIATLRLPRHGG
ncbi:MAG: two-component system sensor histidine kinase CreC [Deltaproteobacteria bacterium]|nr:two-component system sensor histidine kinase CreC [Deltaproteobacteria bacterium]